MQKRWCDRDLSERLRQNLCMRSPMLRAWIIADIALKPDLG